MCFLFSSSFSLNRLFRMYDGVALGINRAKYDLNLSMSDNLKETKKRCKMYV